MNSMGKPALPIFAGALSSGFLPAHAGGAFRIHAEYGGVAACRCEIELEFFCLLVG
jgi:hypothetical protein